MRSLDHEKKKLLVFYVSPFFMQDPACKHCSTNPLVWFSIHLAPFYGVHIFARSASSPGKQIEKNEFRA